jgi:uncharacterized membrane protein YgcG
MASILKQFTGRLAWLVLSFSTFFVLSCNSSRKATAPASTQSKPKAEAKVVFPAQHTATPADINYVYDYEDIFTAAEEKKLDSLVRNFEKSNLIPIKIATIKDPSVTAENFDQANKALLDEWAAVHGKSDKCMSISISKNLRHIRIDYGPFVAKLLSDTETGEIIENQFKPSFKEDQYFTGTYNGVTTLMNTIRKNIKF